jgi:hypothetical protein
MKSITLIDESKNLSFSWYDNGSGSILRQPEGFEYPETNSSIEPIPSRRGAHFAASNFTTRRLSWSGDLFGSDVFTVRRSMVSPANQGELKLLKFTTYDDLLLQCYVTVDKISNPYSHSVHTYLIEAIAPDWRFYSQTIKSKTIPETVIDGGSPIPSPISMQLLTVEGVDNIFTNEGNEDTYPVITITGPGTNFTIGNGANNQAFTLNTTLLAGETIIVDCLNATVTDQAGNNLYSIFDGDFIAIEPGDNPFFFSADSGITNDSSLKIDYRDAYRGL